MKQNKFYFFALAAYGKGISGGDRIFIELARNWSNTSFVNLFVEPEGKKMCERQNLSGKYLKIKTVDEAKFKNVFVIKYLYKILQGINLGLTLKIEKDKFTYLYSASEFWMDSLPAFILKIRYPNVNWVASWYQTAPNPLKGFSEGNRAEKYSLSALFYWLVQLPIKSLVERFADYVLVNNQTEIKQFPKHAKRKRTLVLIGAVKLREITSYKSKNKTKVKKYDAVFQGRFHPQKGVVELIDIWKTVVEKKPDAKLAMIGDGSLMNDVKSKIKELKLAKNIELFGYVFDGNQKYRIFSESKIVVHPAFYDSGGMASAEAMAFGLPCVGFDLKAYKSYYPRGMVKVPIGDINAFASEILKMLKNSSYRNKIGKEALTMIKDDWSWEKRAKQIYDKLTEI